jgi:hypothetical protein
MWLGVSGGIAAADSGDIAFIEDTDGAINSSASMLNVYNQKASCAFYKNHADIYDVQFIFTTQSLPLIFQTPAGWTVKTATKGIGRDMTMDQTTSYCAKSGRLKHSVKMGEVGLMPGDPDAQWLGNKGIPYTGLELIAHEMGHYWMARINYKKDGADHCLLRTLMGDPTEGTCDGYKVSDFGVHWSYFFNSRSPMFGSFIDDLGDGTFKIYHDHPKYSHLDQYLMGLRYPEQVEPMFLIKTMDMSKSGNTPLLIGQSEVVEGERVDISIQDVIDSNGARVPDRDPCHWKAVFAIVHPKGQPPTKDQIAKIETYRARWEAYYEWATDGRGSVDTTLDGRGTGTAKCPGLPTPGNPDAGVEIDAGIDASHDAAVSDAGAKDGGRPDGGTKDAGVPDGSSVADASTAPDDAAAPDAGGAGPDGGTDVPQDNPAAGCSCAAVGL